MNVQTTIKRIGRFADDQITVTVISRVFSNDEHFDDIEANLLIPDTNQTIREIEAQAIQKMLGIMSSLIEYHRAEK